MRKFYDHIIERFNKGFGASFVGAFEDNRIVKYWDYQYMVRQ
jgi:hypothetical protein